ncbi:MAG: UDP-N-acetylglucosamine 2-epimerase [Planctomycetota bacterium]
MTSVKTERRRIAVVTGTRADFGLLRPVLSAIAGDPRLELRLIASGMHFSVAHGETIREIVAAGFEIAARVPALPADDSPAAMARSVGVAISGFPDAFAATDPAIVLVLGDRVEMLAAAVSAAYLGIPIAHIHGGDLSWGTVDDAARHAISKFAHVHFAATPLSARRLRGLGEEERRIHVVGAPGLDGILHAPRPDRGALERALGRKLGARYAVLIQHAIPSESSAAGAQMSETLAALRSCELPVEAIYPNSDSGGGAIIAALERCAQTWPELRLHRSLPHAQYLALLEHATVLVGNSSSGVIEAASFELPVVNIGNRQAGRERGANVIDAPPERAAIAAALARASTPSFRATLRGIVNPYGDGRAAPRIAEALATLDLGPTFRLKTGAALLESQRGP